MDVWVNFLKLTKPPTQSQISFAVEGLCKSAVVIVLSVRERIDNDERSHYNKAVLVLVRVGGTKAPHFEESILEFHWQREFACRTGISRISIDDRWTVYGLA